MRSLLRALVIAAAVLGVSAPAAHALPAVGLNHAGTQLVMYDTAAPGTITERHDITGLKPTETIMGLDVRPATGQLYALGIVRTAFDEGRVYVLDPGTGAATAVGPSPFKSGMTSSEYGFDFNPVADRIRVVSRAGANLRVNPDSGALAAEDTNLTQNGIDAAAYDQNNPGTPQTTLWAYNAGTDRVVRIGGVNGGPPEGSPNGGTVIGFGVASGISTAANRAEMDVAPGGSAFLTAQTAGPTYSLYAVSLGFGTVTLAGNFPEAVEDLAVLKPSTFRLEAAAASEDAGAAVVTVTREGSTSGTQTVAYATSDGSAGASDYTAASGTLTFGAGEASKTFSVPLTNDGADEPAETVGVALSAPTGGAALGSPASGALTIFDDDGPASQTPPPPPPPPPADTVKPQLLLSAPSALGSRSFLKGLAGSFSCSEGCTAKFTLKLGSATIGTAARKIAAAGNGTFRVKLSSKGSKAVRKALARKRAVRVSLSAAATDAAGNTGVARASVKVSR